jgi:hypothetical protein
MCKAYVSCNKTQWGITEFAVTLFNTYFCVVAAIFSNILKVLKGKISAV